MRKEFGDALPTFNSCCRTVARTIGCEEAVPCVVVAVEFVRLARVVESLLELTNLFRCGVLVVRAEQPEQGAAERLSAFDDRQPLQPRCLGRRRDDEGSVAVDRGVQRRTRRGEKRLPA